jgi:tRNA U34 5-methylaminomethyl-2-thiouridine-forming methyltransferase MnmC
VYFDAFSPERQPELWQENVFDKIFRSMSDESVLVTYCAKGVIKRRLRQVGFEVESLAGPPGKREITRAIKVVK